MIRVLAATLSGARMAAARGSTTEPGIEVASAASWPEADARDLRLR